MKLENCTHFYEINSKKLINLKIPLVAAADSLTEILLGLDVYCFYGHRMLSKVGKKTEKKLQGVYEL